MSDVNDLFRSAPGESSESPTVPNPDLKEQDFVRKWLDEIAQIRKLEKDYRKEAGKIINIYECEKGQDKVPFNILYANTETLSPAVYNQVPRPVVKPRFKEGKSPLPRYAARVGERLLEFLLDTGDDEYPSFDDLLKSAVLSALVPGRGVVKFKYDAELKTLDEGSGPSTTPEKETAPANSQTPVPAEEVTYETVCGDYITYDCFFHGYAKTWKGVPWYGYEHLMTREELDKNFGEAGQATKVSKPEDVRANGEGEVDGDVGRSIFGGALNRDVGSTAVAPVFEIWDKVNKKVIFLSPNNKNQVLKKADDPLKLQGFFPGPRPLQFFAKLSTLLPTPLYAAYEQQASELNETTRRITAITKALKVRGFYNATLSDIKKVLTAKDNDMIPVTQAMEVMSQGGKLTDAIFMMPIETLVAVLQQLVLQRDKIKQTIYEITGIADVMRGATQASETLGAQELKSEWGTLRLKRMQKEVARFARDSLRIMLEIAVTKLSVETVAKMTGLPFPTAAEKAKAQESLAQMQTMMAMQQAQTGQPPQPNPAMEQIQEVLALPSWEDLLAALQDDLQRNYNIDIETNSTVDLEATEDKKDLGELLNAIAQFLNGVGPMIAEGIMPFEVAKAMLTNILSRFRMGDDVIDMIDKMQPPQPKDDGSQAKLEMEKEKHKAEMEQKKADAATDVQLAQMDMQAKQQEHQLKLAEMQMKMQEMQRKAQLDVMKHQMEMQKMQMEMQAAAAGIKVQEKLGEQKLVQGEQQMQLQQKSGEQKLQQQAAANKQKQQQQAAQAKQQAAAAAKSPTSSGAK